MRIDRTHSDRASKAGALPGLAAPHTLRPVSGRRGVWPRTAGSLLPNPAFASHECRQRTRVCHADAPAPLGSRERASRCCAHRWGGALPPNFCNGYGLRHPLYPTRPLRLTSATSAPASMLCMHLCPGSRTDLPALPDSSPAPRSEPHCNILPPYCSAAGPGSETRQPEPLASHALLHGVRSCTSSPELPPVAYQIDDLAPTLFGGCQRRWSVGSGGAENTNWRTQVFRAILERQCVLESERGSACLTRETRKQRGVVGVRLGPRS